MIERDGSKEMKDKNKLKKTYAGCSNAGAPVCICFYCDVGEGSTQQRTQQHPKALNLKQTQG